MSTKTTAPHLQKGQLAEQSALAFLESKGLKLIERNYSYKTGEIDLIMLDNIVLVFVEVRYRNSDRFGTGADSITRAKRQRIINTAKHFLQRRKSLDELCRFDVISASRDSANGMKLNWIKHAFD